MLRSLESSVGLKGIALSEAGEAEVGAGEPLLFLFFPFPCRTITQDWNHVLERWRHGAWVAQSL